MSDVEGGLESPPSIRRFGLTPARSSRYDRWFGPPEGGPAGRDTGGGVGVGHGDGHDGRLARPPGGQRAGADPGAQGPDAGGVLARRGPDVLAGPRAEARVRPRGPALVVHEHAQLVRLALAP